MRAQRARIASGRLLKYTSRLMSDYLCTVELPHVNGIARDSVVNTFAFRKAIDLSVGEMDLVCGSVIGFYNSPGEGLTAPLGTVGSFISPRINRAIDACTVRLYDITGKLGKNPATGKLWAHGSPVRVRPMSLVAAVENTSLPRQVAVCLTLRARDWTLQPVEAAPGAGDDTPTIRPRKRRSGRLYIGPLNAREALGTSPTEDARPSASLTAAMAASAENLQQAVNVNDIDWCVWSRSDAAMHAITEVSVDNSYDVIRSRKLAATARPARVFAPVPPVVLGA